MKNNFISNSILFISKYFLCIIFCSIVMYIFPQIITNILNEVICKVQPSNINLSNSIYINLLEFISDYQNQIYLYFYNLPSFFVCAETVKLIMNFFNYPEMILKDRIIYTFKNYITVLSIIILILTNLLKNGIYQYDSTVFTIIFILFSIAVLINIYLMFKTKDILLFFVIFLTYEPSKDFISLIHYLLHKNFEMNFINYGVFILSILITVLLLFFFIIHIYFNGKSEFSCAFVFALLIVYNTGIAQFFLKIIFNSPNVFKTFGFF